MTDDEILTKLQGIVREILEQPDVVLTPQSRAADVPRWDSFNHITIIVTIEKDLGVKFTAPELGATKNVGDMIALVRRKLARG